MVGRYWWIVDIEDYPDSDVKGRYPNEQEANRMVEVLKSQYDSLVVVPARNMFEAIEKAPDYCNKGRDWIENKKASFFSVDDILKLDPKLIYG